MAWIATYTAFFFLPEKVFFFTNMYRVFDWCMRLKSCRIKKEWSNCCRSVLGRSDLLLLTNARIFNFVSQNSFIEKCNIHTTGTEPVFKGPMPLSFCCFYALFIQPSYTNGICQEVLFLRWDKHLIYSRNNSSIHSC